MPINATAVDLSFESYVKPFLENHCLDCHDADTQKGELSLDEINGVSTENFDVWKRMGTGGPKRNATKKEKISQVQLIESIFHNGS